MRPRPTPARRTVSSRESGRWSSSNGPTACSPTAEPRRHDSRRRGSLDGMVLPGGSAPASVTLAIAADDLRQLADHDATHRTFPGAAGELVALDTGGNAVRGTVLMVAGYTGSKEDFAPLLAPLAEAGYRVVAIDQRGQYESPGPDDPAAYSVTELGADVLEVARVLKDET